jgi:serine/threonine protein kinase
VDAEKYRRVVELFEKARPLDAAARRALLNQEPDPEVRELAEDMLRVDRPSQQGSELMFDVPDSGMLLTPGQRIGNKYDVVREIGRGGMGVVYLASDVRLAAPVALKVLRPELANDPGLQARFLREAQLLRRASHPKLATVFEFLDADGLLCIASEYIDGMTLRDRLAGGALALTDSLDIGLQMSEVLKHAAAFGIVHRDLKPENVMCCGNGQLKVLDFGLATIVAAGAQPLSNSYESKQTATGMIVGTLAYMAPEQLHGRYPIDARTDLFALGTMLYELASGVHPFEDTTPALTMARILRDDPKPLTVISSIPAEFDQVVRKCLEKEPSRRYQSASELYAALKILPQEARHAPKPTPVPPVPADPRYWWRAHQVVMTIIYFIIAMAALQTTSFEIVGSQLIFAIAVGAAALGGIARLHLLFVERQQGNRAASQVATFGRYIRYVDCVFLALFTVSASLLVVAHQLIAATIVGTGILFAYGFLVIEPATTKRSFPRRSSSVRRKRTSPAPARSSRAQQV